MPAGRILIAVFAGIFFSLCGCCSYDGKNHPNRIEGVYYPVTLTSDFDATIEISYFVKGTDREGNFISYMLDCFENEQITVSNKIQANAFHGTTVNVFVENGGRLSVAVFYNGKSKLYLTNGTLNVTVRAIDFQ